MRNEQADVFLAVSRGGENMTKEMGPRERHLREQREAKFAENARIAGGIRRAAAEGRAVLEKRIAEAAKKTGKPRKKK